MNVIHLRAQTRAPMFALTVMLLVAAVVAINATAFGAIDALRWKALPYADGDRLVDLQANLRKFGFTLGLTDHLREEVLADQEHFAGALGFVATHANEAGRAWRLARVTPDFASLLGVTPQLGRALVADDARPGADVVLLLSDATWRSRFGADPHVIGREVRLSDRSYTVIGVMPRGFAFPDTATEAWRPYVMSAAERAQSEQGNVGDLDVVARLAPGTTLAQAQAALAAILEHDPTVAGLRANVGIVAAVRNWRDRYAVAHWWALALFQLAALILLAVVLANLMNLHLDRLLAHTRDLDIRRALGASEPVILRGVLADFAPPIVAGLALGLAATPLALHLVAQHGLLPSDLPQGSGFGLAALVSGGVVAAGALATVSVAAFATRPGARLSSRAGLGGLGRMRAAMLIAQVMLTTAMLGTTALLLQSALHLVAVDPGFDTRGVLLTELDPVGVTVDGKRYDPATDKAKYKPVVEALRAEIAALPDVEHAAVATAPPFSGTETVSTYRAMGHVDNLQARGRGVGSGYFAALGIGLVAGREFIDADASDAPVIVDELYRERYLQGVDPLAAYVGVSVDGKSNFRKARIVGVAHTVKHAALDETSNLPTVYEFAQAPLPVFWLVTRVRQDPLVFAGTLRQFLQARAPDVTIGVNKPLAGLVAQTLTGREALLEALSGFAAITLALAALGLAAVLSFAIRRRTAELGVRIALGATPARVRNLVLRQGGVLIAVGAALGLGAGLGFARLLADRLFGIGFTDPASWGATLAVVAAVGVFACWLPARRAAAVDPVVALRNE